MKIISKSMLVLASLLLVAFTIHFFVTNESNPNVFNSLLLTYGFNFTITGLLLAAFQVIIKRQGSQLGSVFMLSSLVKFGLFFLIISPMLKSNGSVKSFSFFAFFIPYTLCIVTEVLITIRLVNQMPQKNDSE